MRPLLPWLAIVLVLGASAAARAADPPLLQPDLMDEEELDGALGEPPPACRIVFDGNTGGVSSGRMELGFGDLLFEYLEQEGGRIASLQSGMGALYREGRYLWTDDGLLSSAISFLEEGGFEAIQQVDPAPLIRTDLAVLLQGVHDPDRDLLDHLERVMGERRGHGDAIRLQGVLTRYRNAAGAEAWVAQGPGMAPDAPLDQDFTSWEVRSQETVVVEEADGQRTLHQLSRMVGEGTRRTALIRGLLTRSDAPAMYVSSGGVVEGRSFVPGQDASLHRPLSWDTLGAADLRLMAPGLPELMLGLDHLTTEAEGAGISLLAANLTDAAGDHPFAGAEMIQLGDVHVAVIGAVDPAVVTQLDSTARSGLDVEPPGPAIGRALDSLRARAGRDPDLTILLAGFEPGTLGDLVAQLSHVDVVIGDFHAAVPRAQVQTVRPTPARRLAPDPPPLLVVHASGVETGELDVHMEEGRVAELILRTTPITQLLPPDPDALARVMEIRQAVYLDGEPVLIPDLRALVEEDINRLQFLVQGQPYQRVIEVEMATGTLAVDRLQLRMTRGLFANLSANLLMERSGADAVVLPPLPWPVDLSGATRDMYASAYLAVPDELQLIELSGAQLRELVRLTGDARNAPRRAPRRTATRGDTESEKRTGAPWVAGLDPTHGKVGGRPLVAGDTYRVLTTSTLRDHASVASVIGGARPRTRFRTTRRGFRPVLHGQPLTLRSQVLRGLHDARDAQPDFDSAYRAQLSDWLRERGETVYPMFYARADSLGVVLTRYMVNGDQEAYANVRESRVTTPGSFTFGLRAGGALGIDTRNLVFETSTKAVLTLNTVGEEDYTELEDDLLVAADLGLKALSIRKAPVYPFLQASYDTEFLRADELDDDGAVIGQQPRQKDLRGTAGATASNLIPTVKTIKTGPFVEYDFSAEEGALEAGISLDVAQEVVKGPFKWGNTLVLSGWFPNAGDTDEDLLISLNLRSELGVILLGHLQLKVYADLLAYRGKVEATADPGLSTIVGVELAYSGMFKARLR